MKSLLSKPISVVAKKKKKKVMDRIMPNHREELGDLSSPQRSGKKSSRTVYPRLEYIS